MLREAGLDAAVLCMPVLPGISDSEESLDAAARAASEAGATAFRHRSLKIDLEIQQYYEEFLEAEFPALVARNGARASLRRCSSSSLSKEEVAPSPRHTIVTFVNLRPQE
ncbi:MAG: hypothetical protein AABM32_02995 [Chloroflexota bacterium]